MNIIEFESGKLTNNEQIEIIKQTRDKAGKIENARVGEALLSEQWKKATENAIQIIYDYLVLSTGNNFDSILKQYKRKYNMENVTPDDEKDDNDKYAIV